MGDQALRPDRPERGSGDEGGWATTGMRWLGVATTVVEVSLAWWVGTLLGVVVLGWAPSSVAAVSVLQRLGTDDASASPLRDFFRVWRANLLRANAVGWPATLAVAVLALNAWVLSVGGEAWMAPLLVGTVLVAAWLLQGVAFLVTLLADERAAAVRALAIWRAALALPLVSPATAVAWVVCAASLGVAAWRFPILVPLAVPGLLALLTSWLMRRRLDQVGVLAVDSRATTSNSA